MITDPAGRVLLVKPNYRDRWSLPGGICEFGEPPHLGCRREVAEEVGIDRAAGRLLVIDWFQPYGEQARPMMHLLFDGGQVEHGHRIVLQESELDDYRFTAADELADYLPSRGLAGLSALLRPLSQACRSTFLTKFSERGSALGRPGWRPRGCGSRCEGDGQVPLDGLDHVGDGDLTAELGRQ